MIPDNLRQIPKSISSNQELIKEALDLGCIKAKVVLTNTISMAHWVKLQCQFGCSQYAKLLTCPPFTPDCDEMAEIIQEYESGKTAPDYSIMCKIERILNIKLNKSKKQ